MIDSSDFDCERNAKAAIRMAAATTGLERVNWVRVAQAWQDLGHRRHRGESKPIVPLDDRALARPTDAKRPLHRPFTASGQAF
jgi:hypothetical protein